MKGIKAIKDFKKSFTLDEIPEYADRYVQEIQGIEDNVIWLSVKAHSFYVPEYEGSEEEVNE